MVTRTTNKHSTNSRLVEHGKFLEVCPPDLLPRPNFKALLPAEKNLEVLLCLTPPWSPLLRSYIRAAAETGRWELWSPFMVEKLLPSPLPMQSDALYLASLVPSCLRRLPFSFPPAPYSNYHSFYSYALYSFRPCCTWPCVSVSKALSTQFPSLANCSEHWNKTLIVWYSRIKNLLHFIVSVPDRAAHLLIKLLENWIDRESFSLSFPTRTSSEACRSDSARETAGKPQRPQQTV